MSFGGSNLVALLDGEDVGVLPPDDCEALLSADVDVLSERRLVRFILANRALINRHEGVEIRAVARLSLLRGDDQSVAAELALTLSETENVIRNRTTLSRSLTERLPHTLSAIESGTISAHKASKIADATDVLSDEKAREVDARMRPFLADKNPGALRQACVRQIHHVDPEGAEERRQQRRAQRKVELMPGADGMTTLLADLPSEVAVAAYNRIDRHARALRGKDKPRTMDQLRADVLTDLLLGNETSTIGPKAEIFVHAAATTLAGVDDRHAELEGHGPITAQLARALARSDNTVLRRVVTDPGTGIATGVGRRRYRPSAALDDLIRVRDRHCRIPGCHRPAHRGDNDHNHEHSRGGETTTANLVNACRSHHRTKDRAGWDYTLAADGALTVTTPTGRRYTGHAEPLHQPRE